MTYACNVGYRMKEEDKNQMFCNLDGKWVGNLSECEGGNIVTSTRMFLIFSPSLAEKVS